MMKRFKQEFALFKYGYGFRLNMIFSVMFLIVGIFLQSASRGMTIVGGYFSVVMLPIYFDQMHHSVQAFDFAAAAPWKKERQTIFPAMANGLMTIVLYLLLAGIIYLQTRAYPKNREILITELMGLAMLAFITQIYLAIVFKKFFLAVLVMVTPMVAIVSAFTYSAPQQVSGMRVGPEIFSVLAGLGFAPVMLLGLAVIIAGIVLAYGISCLLYKASFSTYAYGASLRRQMMN